MRNRIAVVSSFMIVLFNVTMRASAQSPQYLNLVLELSPNSETIAVGTFYGNLILYEADSRTVQHTLQSEYDIYDLAWSPDGRRIAAVSYPGNIKVWDTVSYDLIFSRDLPLSIAFRVNWSPDGQQLAVTSAESGTIVLNAVTGSHLFWLQTGDTADSLWAPSPHLVTADLAGVRVWDGETELSRISSTVNSVITGNLPSQIAYSLDANSIAVYGTVPLAVDASGNVLGVGPVLQTYAFPSLDLLNSIELSLPEQISVMKLVWSSNGEYIAMGTSDGYVRIWNASSLTLLDELFVDSAVRAFDWLTDTEIVFSGNDSVLTVAQVNVPAILTPTATPTLSPTPTALPS